MEKPPQCQQVCIVAAQKRPGLGAAVEVVWNATEVLQDRLQNAENMEESILNQELIKAAREGRHEDVSMYLQSGAFVETRRPFTIAFHNAEFEDEDDSDVGLTPLMHAALGGYTKACRVLLSNGADVNSEDEDRMQPLHFAAHSGNLEVFTLLLQAKANPWAQDASGQSALHYLASDEHKDSDYHARPALKALLSAIAATPAPDDDEVDEEEQACSIAEELEEELQEPTLLFTEASSVSHETRSDGGEQELLVAAGIAENVRLQRLHQDPDHALDTSRPASVSECGSPQ